MEKPSLATLAPMKRKYVRARMSNQAKGKRNAALQAGYSESVARCAGTAIETPDVRAVMRDMIQRRIGSDKIVDRLAEGLDAEKTEFFCKDGVVTDSRNTVAWSERRAYLELAAEYGGYVTKEEQKHLHLHSLGTMQPDLNAAPIDITPNSPAASDS